MKYLILVVLSTILLSCGRDMPKAGGKVTRITIVETGMCKYTTDNDVTAGLFLGASAICDTCGKFNIGDTIKFTK